MARRAEPMRIAIVGAESTGKTALAEALVPRLAAETGLRVAGVPEFLRAWYDAAGRTPRDASEQSLIAEEQHRRIEAAAQAHDIVVCDTTALMTAVYSRLVFGDRSLEARAVSLHRNVGATLLTAVDLPWVADGLQRDGPQVAATVDAALRALMEGHAIAYRVVAGLGPARLAAAMAALAEVMPAKRTRR